MAELSKMTRKELKRLISKAEKALKTLEARERRAALKAAEDAAAKFGFKLEEIATEAAAKPKAKKRAGPKKSRSAKYANPANPKQTWTGMGRRPGWFTEAVAQGVDPKTMEL